ncbi:DUF58 domain-containing protein [Thalassolituus sp. LLYu03]|uniref:DUF58 domain-containing protein n=1 Tax=Thalassolituus sp. LLYu03 TaxID=3421656 RepID=UPI003D27AD70
MTSAVDTPFSLGAEIRAANLVGLRTLAPFLPLHRQRKVLNDLAGTHSSAIRGRGIDYAEVRAYQPGDDIRAMDWRVTARTGDAHIKVFREEKERPVIIVCDLRATMQFGTRRAFKSVVAADLAALLAWSALDHGDRIGALLFSDNTETDIRPKPGRRQVLHLLNALTGVQAGEPEEGRLAQICRHLRRIVRPGSAVYFISDFAGFDDDCERQLYNIGQHSDLVAIRLTDPLDAQLPPPGHYSIRHGDTRRVLNTASAATRAAYEADFVQRANALQAQMNRLRIPLISLSTADADPLPRLRAGLGLGAATRHTPGSQSGNDAAQPASGLNGR